MHLQSTENEAFFPPSGKGPMKEHYLSLIAKKKFERVTIKTMWLSTEDYPLLLGKHTHCSPPYHLLLNSKEHNYPYIRHCVLTVLICSYIHTYDCGTDIREGLTFRHGRSGSVPTQVFLWRGLADEGVVATGSGVLLCGVYSRH